MEARTGVRNAVTIGVAGEGVVGTSSLRQGDGCIASGDSAHAEGYQTTASKNNAHAEGEQTHADGNASHAEGISTTATGIGSHAEGYGNEVSADGAHAEGVTTIASGTGAHSEGRGTVASGMYAHAEGNGNFATENASHSEGVMSKADGIASHAEGIGLNGLGDMMLATADQMEQAGGDPAVIAQLRELGNLFNASQTSAGGDFSHAEGFMAGTGNIGSHAQGFRASDNGKPFSFVWQGYGDTNSLPTHAEIADLMNNPGSPGGQSALMKIAAILQSTTPYESKGPGTFCINPVPVSPGETDPKSGFYIGDESLKSIIDSKVDLSVFQPTIEAIPGTIHYIYNSSGTDALDDKGGLHEGINEVPYAHFALESMPSRNYSDTSRYAVGDIVGRNGNAYRCISAIPSYETWTPAHWSRIPVLANAVKPLSGQTCTLSSTEELANAVKQIFEALGGIVN